MHLIGKMGFSLLKQCLSHCEGERNGSIKKGGGKEQKRYKSCLSCLCPCTADREWAVNVRFGKLQIAYRQSNSLAISNHFMHPEGQLDNYQI